MMLPRNAAMVGAFLMDGAREVDQQVLLEQWGDGFYEFVDQLTQYAEPIWNAAEVGGKVAGGFPGVFDYEVTTVIGKMFAEYVKTNGIAPPLGVVEKWVVECSLEFFMQGEHTDPNPGLKSILTLAFKGILRG